MIKRIDLSTFVLLAVITLILFSGCVDTTKEKELELERMKLEYDQQMLEFEKEKFEYEKTQNQTTPTTTSIPAINPKALLEERCSICHSLDRIIYQKKTSEEWGNVVIGMVNRGANLNNEETLLVINYLSTNYPAPNNAILLNQTAARKADQMANSINAQSLEI